MFNNNEQQAINIEIDLNDISDLIGEGMPIVLHHFMTEFKCHSNEKVVVLNHDEALNSKNME
jgi:hypothetical protein